MNMIHSRAPSAQTLRVEPLTGIDMRLDAGAWQVDAALKARIDAHWRDLVREKPAVWNGTVLATRAAGAPGGIRVEDGVFRASAVPMDYSCFSAWKSWGFPELGFRNVFGSAVIESAEGDLVYGLMGGWTVNAGHVYPPGGSLEMRDVDAAGRVDLVGSIEIELEEETGLDARQAEVRGMFVVFDGGRIAIARRYRFDEGTADLVSRIRRTLASQERPELDDVVVISGRADIARHAMPGYAREIARRLVG